MKTRYTLALAVVAILAGAGLIVSHQHHLNELGDAIVAKDTAAQDVTADLAAAQSYADKHMGVSASVELKAGYNRAQAASQAALNPASNGQVYQDAQTACASKADSIVQARCVQSYLAAHSQPSANPQVAVAPNPADFIHKLKGPNFSTDATGIVLIAATVLLLVSVVTAFRPRRHA